MSSVRVLLNELTKLHYEQNYAVHYSLVLEVLRQQHVPADFLSFPH